MINEDYAAAIIVKAAHTLSQKDIDYIVESRVYDAGDYSWFHTLEHIATTGDTGPNEISCLNIFIDEYFYDTFVNILNRLEDWDEIDEY